MQRLQKSNIIRWLHFYPIFTGYSITILSLETVNSLSAHHFPSFSIEKSKCLRIVWIFVFFSADDSKCRILRQLVSFCENELYDIDLCSECYRNANEFPDNWFTMVCEHPHLLVWAKCDDAYWPAKAMATTNASNATQIYVRYFGGHRRFAYIGSNHCYLYSTIHPEGLHFEEIDDIHQHAISVSDKVLSSNGYSSLFLVFAHAFRS